MTIQAFIAKWRKAELKERSAAQEHFIDLCALFEHPTPAAADPTGETFCFEKGAAKHGGGEGFADVWRRGFFGWEYKGRHKNLDTAYDQLLRYRDALESPPLLVLCDLDRIVVRTNFTGTVSAVHEIPLEALGEPAFSTPARPRQACGCWKSTQCFAAGAKITAWACTPGY